MSTVITPFQGTDSFSTATFNNRISQINTGFSYISNPNLLDNWYFGNPVDQRQGRVVKPNTTYYSDNQLTTSAGTTSAYVTAYRYSTGTANGVSYALFKLEDSDTAPTYYAAPENVVRGYTGSGYGLDRWLLQAVTSCSMLVGDGYITLYAKNNDGLLQKFPANQFSYGDTITVSVLTDTELLSKTITLTESVQVYPYDNSIWHIAAGKPNGIWFVWPMLVYNQSTEQAINIKAAKLELGTTQTLAHQDENGNWVLNEIPDYGEQLARCQRYRRPLESVLCAVSDLQNERYFLSSITYPTMRKTPTVEIQTVDNNVGVIQGVQYIKNTELGVYSVSDSVLSLYIPSPVAAGSAVAGKMAEIFKIWLNAEL